MRDLAALADQLTDVLAHFPSFKVEHITPLRGLGDEYIFIYTKDEIVNGILSWEYQEIEIHSDSVVLHGGSDSKDGSQLNFVARGNWFAVTAIVFAVLSGRE